MKQTVTECMFIDAFDKCRPENFSYEGLRALFNYLEEVEEATEEEMEFDVIAICCDFTEYDNLQEFNDNYTECNCEEINDIDEYTTFIQIDDDSFIIQNF